MTIATVSKSGAFDKKKLLLCLGALGVVFGDIGTSPLYTFKTVLTLAGTPSDHESVLGLLSMILWTLIIVTCIKYVSIALRINNDGEGGIIALMTLVVKSRPRPVLVGLALLGAALIYSDGMITPAISVLSALEGLNEVTANMDPYILPLATVILIGLFAVQPFGVAKIGRAFGPIMLIWFLSLSALGIGGILREPTVLWAINPMYGITYLFHGGASTFLVLSGIFLCATGAEALYADMGNFGASPVRWDWNLIIFPALALNYAGQTALVLSGSKVGSNIFYELCPQVLLTPLIILATLATIIASQSIISGAFAMTRQTIQLNWLPPMAITQTSSGSYGQIYIGFVNWLMAIATIFVTLHFQKSDNLAAAYGVAVSLTMLLTTVLLYFAIREVLGWNIFSTSLLIGVFFMVDGAFFIANSVKFFQGGYVPIITALVIFTAMVIWHKGALAVSSLLRNNAVSIHDFLNSINDKKIARVPGVAVFLSGTQIGTPSSLLWHVDKNRSLDEIVVILVLLPSFTPRYQGERLTLTKEGENFWRAEAVYGFMEQPDVPKLMKGISEREPGIKCDEITYYIGRESIIPCNSGAMPYWMELVYAFMTRNCAHVSDFLELPYQQVVEIGRRLKL